MNRSEANLVTYKVSCFMVLILKGIKKLINFWLDLRVIRKHSVYRWYAHRSPNFTIEVEQEFPKPVHSITLYSDLNRDYGQAHGGYSNIE